MQSIVESDDDDDDDTDEDDPDDDLAVLPDDVFDFDPSANASQPRGYQRDLTEALAKAIDAADPGDRLGISVATGGGKTRIANDWIRLHGFPGGHRVLWVTKDWTLLRQAAGDLCQRAGAVRRLGYCGARGHGYLGALAESTSSQVVYTTIHTWRSRATSDFARANFDVVVIDEVHWGEGKRAYRDLYRRYKGRAVFVGLTATPREGTGFAVVGRAYDYATLADMGYLARHAIAPPVRTSVGWRPRRSGSHGDFDRASLSELARSAKRNKLIVDTYVRGHRTYGKTLIFACDINHAATLARMLAREGISAAALHSQMPLDEQRRVSSKFAKGALRVLVNVAMMTHGVDIPDIETVFLARPTASKGLFAQMVGRAARRTETKEFFQLVDFVDNLQAHGDLLISPQSYFGGLAPDRRTTSYQRSPRLERHAFEPAPFEHVPHRPGFEAIAGFDVLPTQTFGIEFELTRDDFDGNRPRDWSNVAKALLSCIPESSPKASRARTEYHDGKDDRVWNVEWDGTCGWEVTSRILKGWQGFFEVVEVCRALETTAATLGLRVSRKTGTHVHLGWSPTLPQLRRLLELVAAYEPALFSLVAPSRSDNGYCEPIRKHRKGLLALSTRTEWADHFADGANRYLTVNPGNLFGDKRTVEVRMHSGTIEGPKILGWLSLWMRILDHARGRRGLPEWRVPLRELPLCKGPQGDVVDLATRVLAHRELTEHLVRRRSIVIEHWRRDPDHQESAGVVAASWT